MRGFRKYGLEFRERAIELYESGGGSIREVADDYDLSTRTVQNWLRLKRETGSLAPRTPARPGREETLGKRERRWMREWWTANPDLYLREIVDLLAKNGVKASVSMVHRAKEKIAFSRKKRVSRPRNATSPKRSPRGTSTTTSSTTCRSKTSCSSTNPT